MLTPSPFRFARSFLRGPRHVFAAFGTLEDEYRVVVPFLRKGLDDGERVVSMVPNDRSDHMARLREAGIDVVGNEGSGQLEVLRSGKTRPRANQSSMLEVVSDALESGTGSGFQRTRLVVHSHVTSEAVVGHMQLVEYESRLNHLLQRQQHWIMCIYDLAELSGTRLVDILRTHPLLLINERIERNQFYSAGDSSMLELSPRRSQRGLDA